MSKLKKGIIIPFLLLGFIVQAQNRTIGGKVLSSTNEPVSGTSVLVKGTNNGTTTNIEGSFSLSVPTGPVTLLISNVGFIAIEKVVDANVSNVSIVITESQGNLSEVVVTALGITRKTKSLVYATQSVKPAELTEARDANNVINSLQGKVANALITQGSGGPGSGARIVLRGNRSIQGSNNALIVVDGVPIANGTNGTVNSDFGDIQGSDGASSINPDDIESMNILRGGICRSIIWKPGW